MTKVAVLGAGAWGTTIAAQLCERVDTTLWARDLAVAREIDDEATNRAYLGDRPLPGALHGTASIGEALDGASLAVLAVPARGLRGVLEAAAAEGAIAAGTPVLSLVKGMEVETLLRPSEIVLECWGHRPLAVLTGPNLASEILEGQPSASVVASDDEALARELQALVATATLRVYTNGDVVGCEVAGVVKNVMAIATGMAAGLGLGDNTRAVLVTRGLAEQARLGLAMGGRSLTFVGLAGVGDLVATCTSAKSRNFQIGLALGRGQSLAQAIGTTRMIAEGVRSSGSVLELAQQLGIEVPVVEQVHAVCHLGRSPAQTIPPLMRRAAKSEFDDFTEPPK